MPSAPTDLSPDERLLRLVHRASSAGRALRRLLVELAAQVHLSDAELLVVWLCDGPAETGLAQVELSAEIGVSPAQMSATVERLRLRGLIEVQRSGLDRRRQVWRTTETGRQLLATLHPALGQMAAQIDQQVEPVQQQSLARMCEQLSQTVEKVAGELAARQEPRPPNPRIPESNLPRPDAGRDGAPRSSQTGAAA